MWNSHKYTEHKSPHLGHNTLQWVYVLNQYFIISFFRANKFIGGWSEWEFYTKRKPKASPRKIATEHWNPYLLQTLIWYEFWNKRLQTKTYHKNHLWLTKVWCLQTSWAYMDGRIRTRVISQNKTCTVKHFIYFETIHHRSCPPLVVKSKTV